MYRPFSKPISKSEKRILTTAALFYATATIAVSGFDAMLRAAPVTTPVALGGNVAKNSSIWASYKGDAQRTGQSNVAVRLPLSLLWRFTSDSDPSAIPGSPIVVGAANARRVLFNAGPNLYCLDAESGESLWTFKGDTTLRAPLALLPNGANDTVVALSTKGTAYAVRISDGTKAWEYKADSALRVSPIAIRTVRGDRILLPTESGAIVALTPQGVLDPAWKVALGAAPTSAPVVSNSGERIFITAANGNLYGIDVRGGRVSFTVPLGTNLTVTPVAVGNMVIGSSADALVAMRADNGSVSWRASAGAESFTTLAAQTRSDGNNVVYGGTNRGTMLAFNARDGKPLWKSSVGRANLSGSPLVLPGVILVGGRDGVFYGIDSVTGQKRWNYRLESERRVLVQVRNTGGTNRNATPSRSIGGIGGNRLGAGGRATPTPKVYQTQSFGTSGAPAAVAGRIYVPADNAALYAFTAEGYDAAPPVTGDTTLVIPTVDNKTYPVTITPGFRGIPAYGPISMTVKLSDAGSGIDTSTIRATFDGQPLLPADARFDVATGTLTLAIFKQRGDANLLSDGSHTVTVQATDNSGNRMPTATTTFTVNQLLQSPSSITVNGRGGFNGDNRGTVGTGGRGGRGRRGG